MRGASASLILSLAGLLQAPAEPGEPGGRMAGVWDQGSIAFDRFDRFLGTLLHGRPAGGEALDHLLQLRWVETEAARLGLRIPAAEVQARYERARRAVEARGLDFEGMLAERGLTDAAFRGLLRDSLLHERLVLAGREDGGPASVTAEELRQWTSARLAALKAAAEAPPPGFVFASGEVRISEQELGAALRAVLSHRRLEDYLEQLAIQDMLAQWARREGVTLEPQILEEELGWRRRRVEENPAFGGATYAALLEAQHASLEAVRHSDELRAAGYLRLLARRRYDDAWFDALSAEDRRALERRFGAARQVAWILLRSVEAARDPLDLTHADARAELERYRAETATPEHFLRMAGKYSEDEPSRRRQGVLGWVHADEPGVDPALCAAAFAASPGEVSGPFRTAQGEALVLVLDVRPPPAEERFREEVRRSLHARLRQEFLAEHGLRTAFQGRN